ncbi:MAG: isoprenylcysteine carboxylmethyltransferase family protein [Candidatus Bathyarchaeota archaeon]|nr:isoprenylcysteine carboxylmethyltransferase family protein [Candidatus Bathyarchaeota archaeon]
MISSIVILFSLIVFWGVSLLNVLKHKKTGMIRGSEERSISPAFLLALVGTLLMFAESLSYSFLDLIGYNTLVIGNLFTPSSGLQLIGAITYAVGALLHAWSVQVRGSYAVSWAMSMDHKLIRDAPYSLVRHPSYLGYMLMIIALTLIWGNVITMVSWIAIPGYYLVSIHEESILVEQFGEEYLEYMRQVNGFIPRILGPRETREEK